jgi:hypothetical protein
MLVDNLDRPAAAYHLHIIHVRLASGAGMTRITSGSAVASLCLMWVFPWILSNLACVAADKHPVEKASASHLPHWLINQFWPGCLSKCR